MRALPLLFALLLVACDSGPGMTGPGETEPDALRLTGTYYGVGVPTNARQASVTLRPGTPGVGVGTSTVPLYFLILDGPGSSVEEVGGDARLTLEADGAVSLTCDCQGTFQGRLSIRATGTATADEVRLSFTGGLQAADVALQRQ